jgi:D-sedoheptulose 7-phosphate isomerase
MKNIKPLCNFENIENKIGEIINTPNWKLLIKKFKVAEHIYVIGNGGNWAVATHAAVDLARLTNKKVFSLDSTCYVTSIANDAGYENIFSKWLNLYADKKKNSLLISFSATGTSKNIVNAINWSQKRSNFDNFLLTAQHKQNKNYKTKVINLDLKYFHSAELLVFMLFYEMVYQIGYTCPTITGEINRRKRQKK